MAGQSARSTNAGTRDPGAADSLTPEEQEEVRASDSRDNARRARSDTSGKRIRAIPAVITKSGDRSSRVEVSKENFRDKGIDHPSVTFDFQKDNFTLPVGENGVSEEAADFLTKNYPTSFEYMNQD